MHAAMDAAFFVASHATLNILCGAMQAQGQHEAVSFQRVVVPMLRLVTLPRFQNSTLVQFVNQVPTHGMKVRPVQSLLAHHSKLASALSRNCICLI